ncbi:MAG: stage III sporulation AC/AD family protein [Clostridia bacterium]|nr:stage III sporulation AC/AD family protein [Clostridia bacterium]
MLFKICACALIGAICAMTLKNSAKNAAITVAILSSLLIIGAVILRFSGAVKTVTDIMKDGGMTNYGKVMIKSLGIGIVVNTVGSICRDMGETSLSSGVELAGKIEILLICLPVITEMLSFIKELLI